MNMFACSAEANKHTFDSLRSLVVPAMGVTIARFLVASLLYSVDLPTLGLPTITTRKAPLGAGALSGGLGSRPSAGGAVVRASRGRRRPAAYGRVLSARRFVLAVVDGGGGTAVAAAVMAGFGGGATRAGVDDGGEGSQHAALLRAGPAKTMSKEEIGYELGQPRPCQRRRSAMYCPILGSWT